MKGAGVSALRTATTVVASTNDEIYLVLLSNIYSGMIGHSVCPTNGIFGKSVWYRGVANSQVLLSSLPVFTFKFGPFLVTRVRAFLFVVVLLVESSGCFLFV